MPMPGVQIAKGREIVQKSYSYFYFTLKTKIFQYFFETFKFCLTIHATRDFNDKIMKTTQGNFIIFKIFICQAYI
jgi:hypothetical protein